VDVSLKYKKGRQEKMGRKCMGWT